MEVDVSVYIGLGGAAIVFGLIQWVKSMLACDDVLWSRLLPPISLALGLGWNLLCAAYIGRYNWAAIAILGIFCGLSASGFYSQQKSVRGE
jgi:hypothetical protein